MSDPIPDHCIGCIDTVKVDNRYFHKVERETRCNVCQAGDKWTPPKRFVKFCNTCQSMHGRPPATSSAETIYTDANLPEECRQSAANYLRWTEKNP